MLDALARRIKKILHKDLDRRNAARPYVGVHYNQKLCSLLGAAHEERGQKGRKLGGFGGSHASNVPEDAEDEKRVETRNKADQLCYSVEKALVEVKGKLPADKVADIESKVKSLRSAIEKEDHDAIKSGTEVLEKAMSEVASMAYGAGGGPGGPGDAPPPGAASKKAGDVIDAEFEETN